MKLGPIVRSCLALLFVGVVTGCSSSEDNATNTGGSAGATGTSAGNAGVGGALATAEIAQWPMPNGPGLGLPNAQAYDAMTTAGVVHDAITGLDWLQAPGIDLYSRADALEHCDSLSLGGFDDFRVPSFIELVSLFNVVPNDADLRVPLYISPTFAAEGRYWAASAVTSTGLGRLLDFTADDCSAGMACSIGVAGAAETPLGGAFCVRNSRPLVSSPRYEINGDQVTDPRTGLVWLTVSASLQTSSYGDAVATCQALGEGARLPSINELLSILVPILDNKAFPGWPADAFAWSSSAVSARPGNYWLAAITGRTEIDTADGHNRVQCVR